MDLDLSSPSAQLAITIIRSLHIVAGLIWVGAALLMSFYIEPTAERSGIEGKRFLRGLYQGTNFPRMIPLAALVTIIAGLLLYEMLATSKIMNTGMGMALTLGASFGLLAFGHGAFTVWRVGFQYAGKLKSGAGDEGTLTTLEDKIRRNGRISMWLALLSLLLMAGARYLG